MVCYVKRKNSLSDTQAIQKAIHAQSDTTGEQGFYPQGQKCKKVNEYGPHIEAIHKRYTFLSLYVAK